MYQCVYILKNKIDNKYSFKMTHKANRKHVPNVRQWLVLGTDEGEWGSENAKG